MTQAQHNPAWRVCWYPRPVGRHSGVLACALAGACSSGAPGSGSSAAYTLGGAEDGTSEGTQGGATQGTASSGADDTASGAGTAGQTGGPPPGEPGCGNGFATGDLCPGAPISVPAVVSASWLVAADLTQDGLDDLAVTVFDGAEVLVLPSLGDGTFAAAGVHAVGSNPVRIAVGDVNGDGNADIIAPTVNTWGSGGAGGTISYRLRPATKKMVAIAMRMPGIPNAQRGP